LLPNSQIERRILDTVLSEQGETVQHMHSAVDAGVIQHAAAAATAVHLGDAVRDYIVRLVSATRGEGLGGDVAKEIRQASSPRGSIYLAIAAKANAWLDGRDHVNPEDVEDLASDVLSGRIALHYRAIAEGITARDVVHEIIRTTPKL